MPDTKNDIINKITDVMNSGKLKQVISTKVTVRTLTSPSTIIEVGYGSVSKTPKFRRKQEKKLIFDMSSITDIILV